MSGPPKRSDQRKRNAKMGGPMDNTPKSPSRFEAADVYEYEEVIETEPDDQVPVDIEQSKRQLRRMSLQMAEIDSELLTPSPGPKTSAGMVVRGSGLASLKDPMGLGSDVATGEESDEDTIIEEIYDEEEEIEEVVDESEILEEDVTEIPIDDEDVLEEVLEEVVEEEEEELLDDIAEGTDAVEEEDDEEDEDEEAEEEDEEEDEDATEEEVREAIVYILKQEKPIDNGHLTSSQATRMMALPFADLKEIMKHFEVCDNTGEPICWNLIREVVTPEGESPEDDDDSSSSDDDDDDCQNNCVHGYGYCVECGVTDSKDAQDSSSSDAASDGEDRDEVGSLGSGFDLDIQVGANDSYNNHASVSSFNEGSESECYDPKTLREYKVGPLSPRSRGSM